MNNEETNNSKAGKNVPEQLKPYTFQKGFDPRRNITGENRGSVSVITEIRRIFEEEPEQFKDFINKYLKDPRNRQHIVEMIDGKPQGSNTQVAVQVNNNN